MHRRPVPLGGPGVVLLTLLVLTGCGGPPTIPTYDVGAADRATCRALVDDLPRTLAGEDRVTAQPDDALGAAWGDPAIVVACGAPVPTAFRPPVTCERVDGVEWFVPEEERADTTLDLHITAAGYRPALALTIPSDYRPQDPTTGDAVTAAALAQLSAVVAEHLELEQRCG